MKIQLKKVIAIVMTMTLVITSLTFTNTRSLKAGEEGSEPETVVTEQQAEQEVDKVEETEPVKAEEPEITQEELTVEQPTAQENEPAQKEKKEKKEKKQFKSNLSGIIDAEVVAGENASLPEDTQLKIKKLNEKKELKDAEKTLKDFNVKYDGFVAFDFSFVSKGTEVEPNDDVKVTFTLAKKQLPDNADLDTVKIVHFKEDPNTGKVKEVETVDTPDVVGDNLEAEFELDSFSVLAGTYNLTGASEKGPLAGDNKKDDGGTTADPVKPSSNFIKVGKTFAGLNSKDQIPQNYSISVRSTSGGSTYTLNLSNADEVSSDGLSYRWKINDAGVGKYTVSETNYAVEGYDVSVTPDLTKPVEVKAGTWTVTFAPETTCSHKDWPVKIDGDYNLMFGAALTSGQKCVVISKHPLSATEKATVNAAIDAQFSGNWKTPATFINIDDSGYGPWTVSGKELKYNPEDGCIWLKDESNWSHVAAIKYKVSDGENPDINIVNTYTEKTGDIEFTKVNDKNAALAGATFGLFARDAQGKATGDALMTATSKADGKVTFNNVKPGNYVIKETQAPATYKLNETEYLVTVIAEQTVSINDGKPVVNTPKNGNIEFIKVDDNEAALAGATFGLFAKDAQGKATGDPLKTEVSGTNGKVVFSNVAPGEYIVKEISAPATYELNETEYPVTVTAGGTATINDGASIENTPIKTSVTAVKVWNDNNNQDGVRPASVRVQLYADGEAVEGKIVEIKGSENWTATINGLPKFKDGQEITYTIVELNPEGTELDVDDALDANYTVESYNGMTVTNKHIPATTSVEAKKIWDDADDQDGIRPASVTVQLLADNVAYGDAVVLNAAKGWYHKWDNLPEKAAGKAVKYTIVETTVPTGYTATYGTDEEGVLTVTNKHVPAATSVEAKKIWDDANNQDGVRPASVTVQLYADGEAVEGKIVEIKGSENWAATINGLPKFKDGQEITYTIVELNAEGTELDVDDALDANYTVESYNGMTVTNKHVPARTFVEAKKIWDDANNQDDVRPASVTVQLLADGEAYGDAVVLNAAKSWYHKWDNLPEKAAGKAVEYTIVETTVPTYYKESYGIDENGVLTVTNKYVPEETSVEATKIWDDADNQDGVRPSSVKVQLLADGAAKGEPVELNEEGNWKYEWKNLPKKVAGKAIVYTIVELKGNTALKEKEALDANYTVDSYDGMTVTNKHVPATTFVEAKKIWDDADNQDGIRPESVTVQLLADNVAYGDAVVLNAANKWYHKWDNLPEKAAGKAVKYTIVETVVPKDYEESYGTENGILTVTNKHVPQKTSVDATKVWDDADNQDGIRPDKVKFQLLANDVEVEGQIKELSKRDAVEGNANTWKVTFEGLDKFADGKEITYTVKEVGTTVDEETQAETLPSKAEGKDYTVFHNGLEVTNKYEPEKTSVEATKIWDDADNQDGVRPDTVTFQLLADGVEVEDAVKVLSSADAVEGDANTWKVTFENLDKFADGKEITYTVKEVGEEDGKLPIKKNEEPAEAEEEQAPAEEEKFYEVEYSEDGLTVTNSYEPELTSVEAKKIWDDESDLEGLRPEAVTFQLFRSVAGSEAEAVKDAEGNDVVATLNEPATAADEWTVTFDELPKFEGGIEIEYSVKELKAAEEGTEATVLEEGEYLDANYKVHYDEFAPLEVTNEYAPVITSMTITKILENYNEQEDMPSDPTAFVFDVKVYMPGDEGEELVFSDVYALQFNAAGTDYIKIDNLPVGARVVVEEVNANISYEADAKTKTIEKLSVYASKNGVEFRNKHDDNNHREHGVQNTFTKNGGWNGAPASNEDNH